MRIVDFFEELRSLSLSYEDVILLPGYVDFAVADVQLKTQLTRELSINIPIVSSPMDTVTEASLATAIALEGGLGFVHYNMSVEEQLKHVKQVKRYKNGVVTNPVTLPPEARIRDVVQIKNEQGYSIIPVTDSGKPTGRLVGMITKYDYSAFSESDLDQTVAQRMIPRERLDVLTTEEMSVEGEFSLQLANERLLDSHGAALAILNGDGTLFGLVTRADLQKRMDYPRASTDPKRRSLLVGAAIETWPQKAEERLEVLQDDVDVVVFDTSQGYSRFEIDLIKRCKKLYPHLQVIAGNVVTAEACEALIAAGADAIRVGMGIGSICTTQEVGGIGRGQASAVYQCGRLCAKEGVPLIADGGISKSSDMVKALCLGASSVMLGSLLACTEEAPGKCQIKDGVKLKDYRGMGSAKAMEKGSSARYGIQNSQVKIPEGVSGKVAYKGKVSEWVPLLVQGMRQGLNKLGYSSIAALHEAIAENRLELERRSDGAKREGSIHSLYSFNP
jgi:IMP dehydrogenase